VGDNYQLAPIGRGEIFRKYVDKGGASVLKLEKCYRADSQDLFQAYQTVREGLLPSTSANFTVTLSEDVDDEAMKIISSMTKDCEISFIAWQNKDVFKLNKWIQEHRLGLKGIGPQKHKWFYKGDRVIYVGENEGPLTNSLCGVISDITPKGVKVAWESGESSLVTNMQKLTLGYCSTVHKSQGSEYEHVAVICYDVRKMCCCLDRRWLYTAVTRGKQSVRLVAPESLSEFVCRDLRSPTLMGNI
jgi:exodeoxyribonuclease V alpha subunit